MNEDLLARVLLATFLACCWAGIMWSICRARSTAEDVPAWCPLILVPFVLLWKAQMKLWRSQRIAAFLQFADDLRMRKQRVDGLFPRSPRR